MQEKDAPPEMSEESLQSASGGLTSDTETNRRGILKSAMSVSGITVVSRVLGLVREQVRAHFLGTSLASDAFGLAFQIPNLLRRLVGEGAMSAGFIPVLSEVRARSGDQAAFVFARRFFNLALLAITALSALGVLGAGLIVSVFAALGGQDIDPEARELTTSLTRVMFPYIALISWAAIAQGVLNTFRVFWVSAFTSVLLNIAIIASAVILCDQMGTPAYGFAIGVVLGGCLQFFFQVPYVYRLGFSWRPDFQLSPAVKKTLWLLVPTLFGAGVYQVNVLVSQAIAWRLGSGAVSSLQYSSRLIELTLGVFAVAVSTVVLPNLATDAAEGAMDRVGDTVLYTIRLCCFVCFPVTAALFLVGTETISLLFERGAFGTVSAGTTAYALAFHVVGLSHIAVSRILISSFYAFKDTRTPVLCGVLAMVMNISLCYGLAPHFDLAGIAMANSLSIMAQAMALGLLLRRHTGVIRDTETFSSLAKSLAATLTMSAVVVLLSRQLQLDALHGFSDLVLPYLALVAAAVATYTLSCALLKHGELAEFTQLLRRR
tara:strand:+ start:1133 stop:2770 length:1638 start_codon:yes stop_codon:yes gene_type:complete